MNVLVDTSVWSLVLRRNFPSTHIKAHLLRELVSAGESIYLLGVILQEILQGVKTKEQFAKLKRFLEPFPLLPLTRDDFVYAAELGSLCQRKGVQASTIDFLIASAAIRYNCNLLSDDADFTHIAKVTPLKLLSGH